MWGESDVIHRASTLGQRDGRADIATGDSSTIAAGVEVLFQFDDRWSVH